MAEKERVKTRFLALYDQLNTRQKEAVDAIEGPCLVVAGPGTGKTQTLTMRIANILKETQMDPWNILCLTFTESAATAMRERLVSIIGTPAYYVRIHTFHSFCNDVIQEHPEVFALARDWRVLTDVERVRMFERLIDSLPGTSALKPFGAPYLFLKDIAGNIKELKQEGISPEDFGKVLKNITSFLKMTEKQVLVLHKLKPKERTQAQCERFYEELKKAGLAAGLPSSLMAALYRFKKKFEEKLSATDEPKEVSKACTAFKNDIKQWHNRMGRQMPKWHDLRNVYAKYLKLMREKGRYDYEDMVLMVVEKWQSDKELLAEYQEQFQYMLVDEYQDTNGAQNKVVKLLASGQDQPNVFVVGDDKQSIYRFQGASLNNMLEFFEGYRDEVVVVSLEDNYRSQSTVLEVAGSVISHNEELLSRYIPGVTETLTAQSGRAAMPAELHIFNSEEEEDYAVVQQVQTWVREGVPPEEIAVLFRYNRDGQDLLRMMRAAKIPVRLEAGENVLDDKIVQQFLRLLQYVVRKRGDNILADIIQYDWWEIDAVTALTAMHAAGVERRSLLDVLRERKEFTSLVQRLADWQKLQANVTLPRLLYEVLNESGLFSTLTEDSKLESLQHISALMNMGKQMAQANSHVTLEQFLSDIEALQEHGLPLLIEPWLGSEKAVRLMTAHKAKGLEFERVVLTRMNNKHWGNNPMPNKVSLPHGLVRFDVVIASENNEDERRLFYVALTRAKQQVVLTRARHGASGRETVPSIFVHELGSEHVAVHEHKESEGEVAQRLLESLKPAPVVHSDEVRQWVKSLLGRYIMSVTHLNNYLECPYKFYVKNVLRVPTVKSKHQALGTAVHVALQEFFAAYIASGKRPVKKFLLNEFERSLTREALMKKEYRDSLAVGREQLNTYYEHYKDDFLKNTVGEYNFRSHGVNVGGVSITGTIDKIEPVDAALKKGAKVNVVDYKTGNPERGLRKLKEGGDYHRQLVFYQLLCDESPQFPYKMVSGEVDFVQPSEKKGFIKKKLTISAGEVAELRETIERVWGEIQELKFFDADARCGECEVCTAQH